MKGLSGASMPAFFKFHCFLFTLAASSSLSPVLPMISKGAPSQGSLGSVSPPGPQEAPPLR